MHDPLEALQQASTIGPPRAPNRDQMKLGMMPFTPTGSLGAALSGLRRFLPGAAKVVPEAVSGASRGIPAATETLGETLPEFAPVGGEAMLNIGRAMAPRAMNPMAESAFSRYTAKPAMTPFRALQDAGAFRGERTVRGIGNLQQEAPGGLSEMLSEFVRRMR